MTISNNTLVSEIVIQNYKAASLLLKYNIDFCCNGNITLLEASTISGIDIQQFLDELAPILEHKDPDTEYINQLSLTDLSVHIEEQHHKYVHQSIQPLKSNLDLICETHGERHPEIFEIRDLFHQSAGELVMHMQREELTLFPFIKRMEISQKEGSPLPRTHFGSVTNPVARMMADHQNEGDRFIKIKDLSNNYTPPTDGSSAFFSTYQHLREFEQDLYRHIHLENNILFPRAIELEKEIAKKIFGIHPG